MIIILKVLRESLNVPFQLLADKYPIAGSRWSPSTAVKCVVLMKSLTHIIPFEYQSVDAKDLQVDKSMKRQRTMQVPDFNDYTQGCEIVLLEIMTYTVNLFQKGK